ncbi:DUF4288 domain-containing protein [Nonlabens ponticola]|nr:DUF4288 domain-containing protein [Nonlabens ponticola]
MSQEKISVEKNNWFIVEIIEKCEPANRDQTQDLRRVMTWGNHHLIKANSAEHAFDKAVQLGKECNYKFVNSDKIEMESSFVGIGELIPIYEDIEDGSELMWMDYGLISDRRTMKMPYQKKELMDLLKPKKGDHKS